MSLYVVIGLGNPGKKYRRTRHNVGFDTIECLGESHNIKISKIKYKSVYGEGRIGNEKVLLVKPQTYMNNSGITALEIRRYYDVPVENIIVVYDDVDIDFGALRIRPKGSAGSHNGMKSMIYHLQNDEFSRIRIGVGRPEGQQDLASFVLNDFNKDEREIISSTIKKASEAVEAIIIKGINKAMNEYNG